MKKRIVLTTAVIVTAMLLGITPAKTQAATADAMLCGAMVGVDISTATVDDEAGEDSGFWIDDFDVPEITSIENLANGARISWSACIDAAAYRVLLWDGEDWDELGTVSDRQFIHTDLVSGAAYRYTVRAVDENDGYIRDYSEDGSENIYLAQAAISTVSNGYGGVNLEWESIDGAEKYIISRKEASGDFEIIAQTDGVCWTDSTAVSGVRHTYTVKGAAADGKFTGAYSDEAGILYLSAPEIVKFENTVSGTKITWNSVECADSYQLFVNNGSKWTKIADVKETRFTHDGLESGREYIYTVRCISKELNAESGFNRDGWSNVFYSPPVLVSAKNVNGGVEVKWQEQSGVQRYAVYRIPKNGKWKKLGSVTGTSYIDKTAESGTEYTYTVRCLSDDGKKLVSSYNSLKSVTYVAVPVIKSFDNKTSGTLIKWEKVEGAAKYRIFVKTSGDWKKLADTTSLSYMHNNLTAGTKYIYTIRCLNDSGRYVSGTDKTGKSNVFILPPSSLSLQNVYGGVKIKWSKPEGAQKYRVFRCTANTAWVKLGDTENLTFTDKKATSGETYRYTVRCISADSQKYTSCKSSAKSIMYVEAPSITSFENKADGIKINWSKVAGAAKYRVYAYSSTGWRIIGDSSTTSFTHNNLVNGESYTYNVRCLDKNGKLVSGCSKTGKTTVFIAPPKISEISGGTGGNTLEWQKVDTAYGYRLYRRTVSASWSKLADIVGKTSYIDTSAQTGEFYSYTLRCIDKNGKNISWYIDNTAYYRNGKLATGYKKLDSKYIYFKNGLLQKNKIVGSSKEGYRYADSSGYCVTSAEIQGAVDFVIAHAKGTTALQKLKSCFNYLYKNYTYETVFGIPSSGADIQSMAQRMFKNKKGNCFCFGSAFACIAKVLGYRARAATGKVTSIYGGLTPHGWAEVYSGGQWLLCDPDLQMEAYGDYFMRTRAQFPVNPLVENKKFELTFSNGSAIWK